MPELPEVETIIRELRTKVLNRTFVDVWTDFRKIVKRPGDFNNFKKELIGKKVKKIWRRAKNIIFELSDNYSLLIHQKMTGHLLYDNWDKEDRANSYVHLKFFLDNNKILALSDLRKFAKVELWKTKELLNSEGFKSLGPEPLDKNFTLKKLKEVLRKKKSRLRPNRATARRGKVKQILMDQKVIAGIGNIYSDEILWRAKIHPFKEVQKLTGKEIKAIFNNIKSVLKKAIELRGESISDFRDISGKKGFFDRERRVYRREGEKCPRCGAEIKRVKIGGRSAHFCPKCQSI